MPILLVQESFLNWSYWAHSFRFIYYLFNRLLLCLRTSYRSN